MTNVPPDFIVTHEHRRFAECCDACRRYQYLGLCYGSPGVGKSLSARHYANWFHLQTYASSMMTATAAFATVAGSTTVFYTPDVVNAPRRIAQDIAIQRHQLRLLAGEAWLQEQRVQYQVRKQEEARLPPKRMASPQRRNGNVVQIYEAATLPVADIAKTYAQQRATMPDPTDLIITRLLCFAISGFSVVPLGPISHSLT